MTQSTSDPGRDAKAGSYGRPQSIEDLSNRFVVHPLSALVVKIALPLKISANFVSVLGLGFGLLAGWFYFGQANPNFIVLAFASMFVWHVLDGADGRIARATNTTSALGRIIDGVCDHLVFASVYFGFTFYLLANGASGWVWVLVAAAVISHAVQAAAYEERRQNYHRRANGIVRQHIAEGLSEVGGKRSLLAWGYDFLQRISAVKVSPLDDRISELQAAGNHQQISKAVARTVPLVRAWALLNANNRTIMLAVFAWFGRPDLYLWYEAIVLTLVFAGLLVVERLMERSILQEIDGSTS
ncbi:MAG: hypothetical protein COA47_07170 [Robiginitomaculum sp.]|nr:MAG: hypothetical protein COA47_07170 [Robiginitomaculum sp.]